MKSYKLLLTENLNLVRALATKQKTNDVFSELGN